MNTMIEKARQRFEDIYPEARDIKWIAERQWYDEPEVHALFLVFLNGFDAGQKSHVKSEFTDKDGNTIIDLDIGMWEAIKQAAGESKWIPEEYYMNDWVSDVCRFLREGKNEN